MTAIPQIREKFFIINIQSMTKAGIDLLSQIDVKVFQN